MKRSVWCLAFVAAASLGQATLLVNQTPAMNGGISRWSQLWQDPFGDNDLDSDAICYGDFTLPYNATIERIEWWGDHNPNKGFQVEIWRQDPGTIAYQPLAVFRDSGAAPEASFRVTNYSFNADPSNTIHFSLELPTKVDLAKNDAANPRWFLAVIGLTDVAFKTWNWSQGLGGSHATFQWIRSEGNRFHLLGEGRAMRMLGVVPEPASLVILVAGVLALRPRRK